MLKQLKNSSLMTTVWILKTRILEIIFSYFLELTSTQDTNVEMCFPDEGGVGIHSEL